MNTRSNILRRNYSYAQFRAMADQVYAAEDECTKARRRVCWLMQPGHLGNPFSASA